MVRFGGCRLRAKGLNSHFRPTTGGGGALNSIQHGLISDAILEVGSWHPPFIKAVEEILHGVHEGMLVADDVSRRPPVTT